MGWATWRLMTVMGLGAVLFAGSVAVPAEATHGNDVPQRINDTYWDVSYYQLSNSGRSAAWHARSQGIDPRPEIHTRLTSDLSIDDVAVSDADFDSTWFGQYACIEVRSDGKCEEARIRYDTANIASASDSGRQWSKTGIHEFGHGAGLGHRYSADSAMKSGDAGQLSISIYFDAHDKESISNSY